MHTLSDLINSDDAVSAVVGYILIFAIVVTMVGLIFIVAMPSIENAQERAYIESIKRGITVLDSKASMVALGESSSQTVNIDSKGGIFKVDEDASNITLIMNETGTTIYSDTLGTVTYELDGTVIAYEGGGVWMKYPNGDPVMVSPPEFHYNIETLTLPIIRLRGNEAISGTGTTQFKVAKNSSIIRYPNSTMNFTNPVEGTKDVLVIIQSDYYKAWEKYLKERTDAKGVHPDPDPLERKVYATLNLIPPEIEANLDEPVTVTDIDENMPEPITKFVFNLKASNLSSGLNPLNLEFKTSDAINPQLIIKFKEGGGPNTYSISMIYEDDDADGNWAETWSSAPFAGDLITQEFDMLTTRSMSFDNTPAKPSESWGNNQYESEPGIDYVSGDVITLANITKHYMGIMPAPFEFRAYEDHVDMPLSNVSLHYVAPPPLLRYLHVVEHDIIVDIS